MRVVCCVIVVILCSLAGAATTSADEVLVLGIDGKLRAHDDRALPSTTMPVPRRGAGAVATTARNGPMVTGALKQLRAAGAITQETYAERRAAYLDARRTARRLHGVGRREMTAVVRTVEDIAARRKLTASRLNALWLTLERNV